MGFPSGFAGGVTLTLGVAYLAAQAHQRNRQAQAESLRAQAHLLNTLTVPSDARLPEIPPTSRQERAATARPDLVETAKARWNHELIKLAQLVQSRDTAAVVEDVEDAVARGIASAAGLGADKAREGASQARSTAATVPAAAVETTKGAVASIVDKAKAAVGRAQDKLAGAVSKGSEVVAADAQQLSPVERALRQRYQRTDDVMKKTVEEVLNERYTPISQQDHTVLRGL